MLFSTKRSKPRQIGLSIGKSAKPVYDKCSGVVESYKW